MPKPPLLHETFESPAGRTRKIVCGEQRLLLQRKDGSGERGREGREEAWASSVDTKLYSRLSPEKSWGSPSCRALLVIMGFTFCTWVLSLAGHPRKDLILIQNTQTAFLRSDDTWCILSLSQELWFCTSRARVFFVKCRSMSPVFLYVLVLLCIPKSSGCLAYCCSVDTHPLTLRSRQREKGKYSFPSRIPLQDPGSKVSCQLRTPRCLMGKTRAVDSPLHIVVICSKPINDGH